MHIERARQLKPGATVRCPSDRGEPGYTGRVTHVSPNVCTHRMLPGVEFLWVSVRGPHSTGVWPSNRLG